MAKTVDLKKVKFNVPLEIPKGSVPAVPDVQDMINNYAHLTANDVQTLIDATLSKIARAEDTEY